MKDKKEHQTEVLRENNRSKTQHQQPELKKPIEGDADSEIKGVEENFHPKGDRNENAMEQSEDDETKKDNEHNKIKQEEDQEDNNYKSSNKKQSEGGRRTEANDLKEAEDNHKVNF